MRLLAVTAMLTSTGRLKAFQPCGFQRSRVYSSRLVRYDVADRHELSELWNFTQEGLSRSLGSVEVRQNISNVYTHRNSTNESHVSRPSTPEISPSSPDVPGRLELPGLWNSTQGEHSHSLGSVKVRQNFLNVPANESHVNRPSTPEVSPSNPVLERNQIIESGIDLNIFQLTAETNAASREGGRFLTFEDGRRSLNFGLCSYLGLETHPTIIKAVCLAALRFGSQYSSSVAYTPHVLYSELESLLNTIYEKPVMVSASTTLGHKAAIPILVGEDDAVILDMQVHASVQEAAQLLKDRGIPLMTIRHNDMESLDKKIESLKRKHKKIWYLADGVYSMYGDYANFSGLTELLDKHEQMQLYIDDAHGASWAGKHGRGIVRSHMKHHKRMVLAISLNKSFAAAGGAIIFANEEQRSLVRNCGGTMIFSGPIPPPMLGAACASVKFHLSEELPKRQARLQELIAYCNEALECYGLPQCRNSSPIFFIPVGRPSATMDLVKRIMSDGCYINYGGFPATPMRRCGLRFMMNCHLKEEDVDELVKSIHKHYRPCLEDHGISLQNMSSTFNIPQFSLSINEEDSPVSPESSVEKSSLKIEIFRSIHEVDKEEWDEIFLGRGNLDSESLSIQERVFGGADANPENKWEFRYFIARDRDTDAIVAATFFVAALVKDDMLSPSHKSEKVEKFREGNPYYLTSQAVMVGSLISVGEHLYLNRTFSDWKDAVKSLVDAMEEVREETGANQIMMRSLTADRDPDLEDFMQHIGFGRINLPDTHIMEMNWETLEEYLGQLPKGRRKDLRRQVVRHSDGFRVVAEKPVTYEEIKACYRLYEKVQDRSMDLNTFKLPIEFFQQMLASRYCDVLRIYRKGDNKLVAMMFNTKQKHNYAGLVIGFEKGTAGKGVNDYLLAMFSAIMRSRECDCTRLDLGMTSGESKRRLGATSKESVAFVQVLDHFNHTQIDLI